MDDFLKHLGASLTAFSRRCFLFLAATVKNRFVCFFRKSEFIKGNPLKMDSPMNPAPSVDVETCERIAEIADVMAVGLQRLLARQSSGELQLFGESSLHLSPDQSGDAPTCSAGVP